MPISPGIETREQDFSFIAPQAQGTSRALVGPTAKGPVGTPTLVSSYSDYVRTFGDVWYSGDNDVPNEYFTSYSARDFFNRGGTNLLVSRVTNDRFTAASVNGIKLEKGKQPPFAVTNAFVKDNQIRIVFNQNLVDNNYNNSGSHDSWTAPASYTITKADGSVIPDASFATESSQISRNTIILDFDDGTLSTDGEIVKIVFTGSATEVDRIRGTQDKTEINATNTFGIDTEALSGKNVPYIENVDFIKVKGGEEGGDLVRFHFTTPILEGTGFDTNQFSIKHNDRNTLTLTGRGQTVVYGNIVAIDTTANNLDENTTFEIAYSGSNLESTGGVAIPPFGTLGPTTFGIATLGVGESNNNQNKNNRNANNVKIELTIANRSRGTFNIDVRRGDDDPKAKVVLESFTNLNLDPNSSDYIAARIGDPPDFPDQNSNYIKVTGSNLNIKSLVEGTYLFGGASGSNATLTDDNGELTDGFEESYEAVFKKLENRESYDIDLITVPGLNQRRHDDLISQVISLAETRGDCLAIIDIEDPNSDRGVNEVNSEAEGLNSSYAAAYYPNVRLRSVTGRAFYCPPSVVIPGLIANSDLLSFSWFAPSGNTRGQLPSVIEAQRVLTKADRDILYENNINSFRSQPGVGVVVWGQKTLQQADSLLDKINVRRLLITVKRFVEGVAQDLVFEQNSAITRQNFLNIVNPFFDRLVSDRALEGLPIITVDESINTPDVVARNEFRGRIQLTPIGAIEFIIFDFAVTNSGVETT